MVIAWVFMCAHSDCLLWGILGSTMTSAMLAEIREIPEVVRGLLREGASESAQVAEAVRAASPRVVVVAARGTSDHAGVYARYLFESHLRLPVVLAASSLTTVYGRSMDWRDSLVVGISQSGEAPDVAAVVSAARRDGALTVAITNEPGSSLAGAARHTLACRAGTERAVAATKTYVAELAVVAALVAELTRGAAGTAGSDDLSVALPGLPDALAGVLAAGEAWIERADALVEALAASDRALVVSRGYDYATALEIALKLKETSRIFAEGYSSADLLHGPVALAEPAIPMLVFRPDGPMGSALDGSVARARTLGARPWIVGGRDLAGSADGVRTVALPIDVPEPLTPLAFAIPGQLVAESVARRRGMDPDAPPGLTKVTRTL
jgi:glucosamine--fructose-6-phosphate aminotransferase (isomerizing)